MQKEQKEFQEEIEDVDIAFVKGVGPKLAKLFNKMNIFKVSFKTNFSIILSVCIP